MKRFPAVVATIVLFAGATQAAPLPKADKDDLAKLEGAWN
jgi:hypothetical protein